MKMDAQIILLFEITRHLKIFYNFIIFQFYKYHPILCYIIILIPNNKLDKISINKNIIIFIFKILYYF
jgi:hypothetical protein